MRCKILRDTGNGRGKTERVADAIDRFIWYNNAGMGLIPCESSLLNAEKFVGAAYDNIRKEEPNPSGVFDDCSIDVGGRRVNS